MNTPPIKIAIGSKSLLLHMATNSAASISPCHVSMRSIVLVAVSSIAFGRKKFDPPHQPKKSPGKCKQCARDQQPGRRVEILVRKISDYEAAQDRAWQFERYPQI
jgi:hypothetical protein